MSLKKKHLQKEIKNFTLNFGPQHPAAALFGSLDFQMMKRAVLRSRLKGA